MEHKIYLLIKNVAEIKTDIQQIETSMDHIRSENNDLKEKVFYLESKIDYMERQQNKNDLVFHGLHEEEQEDTRNIIDSIMEITTTTMEIKLEEFNIQDVFRLGARNNGENRPIILKLTSALTKRQIIQNARNLKGTAYAISETYTKKVQEERRQPMPFLMKAKEIGKKAHPIQKYMIFDSRKYSLEEIKQVVELQNSHSESDNGNASSFNQPVSAIRQQYNHTRINTRSNKRTGS
ncbi:hypothetical protein JTB14_005159 [Gonioctena quinquepunctata]|nr:hypothetical protein JTB14_005159 [Gonioctena quinquepunctata]